MKIVVICIDALRADSIGPRMKAFLDANFEFTNAYAAAPATIPSVPTCLTGVPAGEHGLVTLKHALVVPTIMARLRKRGFHTISYSANNLASLEEKLFVEWNELRWMTNFTMVGKPKEKDALFDGAPWNGMARMKATQESYEEVWDDIENRKGDIFAYVHLMDVHGPYRTIPSVKLSDFPEDYRTFRLVQWIAQRAAKHEDPLTKGQWGKLWELYRAEVKYLDDRLEFPGDLVIFMADHGELIGEGPFAAWLAHHPKFFLEESLRIPFAVKGIADKTKRDRPFNAMYVPTLIEAVLDGKELPDGSDLYWEDFWYDVETHAIKNPECPIETLIEHSPGDTWYQDKDGNRTTTLADIPPRMIQMLEHRKARAKRNVFRLKGEDEEIVKERLRGMGYIT